MTGRSIAEFKRVDRSLQTAARAEPARPDGGTDQRCCGGPRRAVLRP
jgi:hypothetical protein